MYYYVLPSNYLPDQRNLEEAHKSLFGSYFPPPGERAGDHSTTADNNTTPLVTGDGLNAQRIYGLRTHGPTAPWGTRIRNYSNSL